jgi:hypothetical protein
MKSRTSAAGEENSTGRIQESAGNLTTNPRSGSLSPGVCTDWAILALHNYNAGMIRADVNMESSFHNLCNTT